MVVVPVLGALGGAAILSGRLGGAAAWPGLESLMRGSPDGSLVVLDFEGIAVVTPSFFLAGFWPAWTPRREAAEIFPVLARLPADSVEDIELALRDKGASVWQVKVEGGVVTPAGLLGPLEAPLQATLDLVVQRDEASPSDLFEHDRQIGLTAWSNRLNALYQHRLVRRRKEGRRMIYAPLWRERRNG